MIRASQTLTTAAKNAEGKERPVQTPPFELDATISTIAPVLPCNAG
jgi:hypothetical protein